MSAAVPDDGENDADGLVVGLSPRSSSRPDPGRVRIRQIAGVGEVAPAVHAQVFVPVVVAVLAPEVEVLARGRRCVVGRAADALRGLHVDGLQQRIATAAAHHRDALLIHQHRSAGLEDRLQRHRSPVHERVVGHARVARERDRAQRADVARDRADVRLHVQHPCPLLEPVGPRAQGPDQQLAVAHQVGAAATERPRAHVHQVAAAHIRRLGERVLAGIGRLLEAHRLGIARCLVGVVPAGEQHDGHHGDHRDERADGDEGPDGSAGAHVGLASEYPPFGGYSRIVWWRWRSLRPAPRASPGGFPPCA